jgi:hypothetical protein
MNTDRSTNLVSAALAVLCAVSASWADAQPATPTDQVNRLHADLPHAIIEAWQVSDAGDIIGEFRPNPNFREP